MSPYLLPTVRVVNPNAPESYMIINVSDQTDEHQLWDDAPAKDDERDVRVVKGPFGRFYLKLGEVNIGGPFKTEAQALAERDKAAP